MKTQMRIIKRGEHRTINCHPYERDNIARIARIHRRHAKQFQSTRPTVRTIREIAASWYS